MPKQPKAITRFQTGVRIEKRILRVLKAIAEQREITLCDLLEGIVLHAFEGKSPFSEKALVFVADAKKLYGLELSAADSHNLLEEDAP